MKIKFQYGGMSLVLSLPALSHFNEFLELKSNTSNPHNSLLSGGNKLEHLLEIAETLKCLKLCPAQGNSSETGRINMKYFPNLTHLQIKRINAQEITLNPSTLSKLEEVKCMFAQEAVQKILKTVSTESMCIGLTRLELQYNKLENWDPELLRSLPSLGHLDVSNNRLTEIDVSESINLRTLNVSFNMLQSIPCFSIREIPKLQKLLLHNNMICDDGLSNLKYLEKLSELSLENNLILEDDSLSELSDLPVLRSLSLTGNPLCLSKNYRTSCVKYLHENACVNHFLLDGKMLSKEEKHLVGSFVSPSYVTYPPNDRTMDQSFEILVPTVSRSTPSKPRRSLKARDALISDTMIEKAPTKSVAKLESPKKHLETKVQIEHVRDRFGEENWLHKQAGSVIQNLMGLQAPQVANAGTNTETRSNSSVSIFASSPNTASAMTDDLDPDRSLLDNEQFESTKDKELGEYILPDAVADEGNESMSDVSQKSDDGELDDTILVIATREPDNKDVLLSYNNVCFKERDSMDTDKVIVWPLKNLTSCSSLNSDGAFTRILISFNCIKPSLAERIYSMESTNASVLCSFLRDELESRPLSAMNQTAYRCIKCSTLFSVERTNNNKYQRVRCQTCGSNAVLEMDETPLPSLYNGSDSKTQESRESQEVKESNDFVKSPSQSSIGSANSLKTIQDVTIPRRNDSDIEVISNPSQSSVEILEVVTRKKSSEERQLVPVPEVLTTPEQNMSQGLTESSSSGSLTDSICTAYDGSRRRTVQHDDCTVLVEEDENKPDRLEVKNQRIRSISHQDDLKSDLINEDSIQLSYSDFSKIDHRVKLHLLTVHFKINEDFVCSVKCRAVAPDQCENSQIKLVVFSTSFMHVFRIVGNTNNEEIESWLKPERSYNISHIESITLLPFQVGFHVKIRSNQSKDNYTILPDLRQTLNFMKFVNDSSHFKAWSLSVKVAGLEKILTESIVQSLEEPCDTCSLFVAPVIHTFQINQNVPRKSES